MAKTIEKQLKTKRKEKIPGRTHPYDEQIGYKTIHADIVTERDFKKYDNLLVENVRWKSNNPNRKGRYLKEIAEIIRPYPKVGIAYDIAHAHINEEPMEEIIEYKDKIKLFHLTDTIGREDKHLKIGEGEIDWQKFFKVIAEIDYKGFLIIERW